MRATDVLDPIVSKDVFATAQSIIEARKQRWSNDELLNHLKILLNREGRLSGKLIDNEPNMPSQGFFSERFDGLVKTFLLAGYSCKYGSGYRETRRYAKSMGRHIVPEIKKYVESIGSVFNIDQNECIITINNKIVISFKICKCSYTGPNHKQWLIYSPKKCKVDIIFCARMDEENTKVIDYYVVPMNSVDGRSITSSGRPNGKYDEFRHDNMQPLFDLIRYEINTCAR